MKKLFLIFKLLLIPIVSHSQNVDFINGNNNYANKIDVLFGYSHTESEKYAHIMGNKIYATLETFLNVKNNEKITYFDYRDSQYPYIFDINTNIYCLTYEPKNYTNPPDSMKRGLYLYKRITNNKWEKVIDDPIRIDEYRHNKEYNTLTRIPGSGIISVYKYKNYLKYNFNIILTKNLHSIKTKEGKIEKQYIILYFFLETPNGFVYNEIKIDDINYHFEHYTTLSEDDLRFNLTNDIDTLKYHISINPKTYAIYCKSIH